MVRAAELTKLLEGDYLILKIAGGKFQLIESEMVRKCENSPVNVTNQGVILNQFGAIEYFCICRLDESNNWQFDRLIHYKDTIYSAYTFRASQIRGISPLTPAVNVSIDLDETQAANLVKSKMAAFFAILIKKGLAGSEGNPYVPGSSDTQTASTNYNIKFKAGTSVNMRPEDSIDMLESKNPSVEYQEFSK
jgi:capsid protein